MKEFCYSVTCTFLLSCIIIPLLSSTNGVFVLLATAQAAGSETYRTDPDFHIPAIV